MFINPQSPMADPARLPPSLWAATAEPAPDLEPLDGERICDIAIVGGGFTGLSAALHAAKAGNPGDTILISAVPLLVCS